MPKEKEIEFRGFKNKKIVADFSGGEITSDAGLLLLREVEKKSKIIKKMSACIEDKRESAKVDHSVEEILKQRVFGLIGGYEDVNDHQKLRNDTTFKILCERKTDEALSSPPTICRLENMVDKKDIIEMSKMLVEQFIDSYKTEPKELMLDFDASDNPVHGDQENKFFHGYYDEYCFLPLYVFCGKKLIVSYLRPAWKGAAYHTWAILALLVKRFREVWPNVRIIFRGDAGFCKHRMFNWCEKNNVDYIVGIAKNPVIEKLAKNIIEKAETEFTKKKEKVRIFGEIKYAAETWSKERRIVVKAERLEEKMNTRYIATNINKKVIKPQELYDNNYCPRGDMENRIKEHQLSLFSLKTSCHWFVTNMLRVILSSIAYNLFEEFQRVVLAGTEFADSYYSTIRTKLIKIGATITENSKKILFRMSSYFPYQDLFKKLCVNLS